MASITSDVIFRSMRCSNCSLVLAESVQARVIPKPAHGTPPGTPRFMQAIAVAEGVGQGDHENRTRCLGRKRCRRPNPRVEARADTHLMRSLLVGIFILMAIYALYFARAFFMPVILAFLLALTLTPIVRFLRKHGIPEVVSATLLVLLSVCVFASAGYLLSGPVIDLINNTSSIGQQLTERLAQLRRPLEKIMQISHQIEQLTETPQEPGVQKVAVAQSGILSQPPATSCRRERASPSSSCCRCSCSPRARCSTKRSSSPSPASARRSGRCASSMTSSAKSRTICSPSPSSMPVSARSSALACGRSACPIRWSGAWPPPSSISCPMSAR